MYRVILIYMFIENLIHQVLFNMFKISINYTIIKMLYCLLL